MQQTKGYEILHFDGVELTKTVNGAKSFVDINPLKVLYFPDMVRFILSMGEWDYALLKRLPITSSSRTDIDYRYYHLPASEGFYTLKISKIPSPAALKNFETILSYGATLYYEGETRAVEGSETINETTMEELEHSEAQKLKGGQKIKRGFAKLADKLARPFTKANKDNLNLFEEKDINALKDFDRDYISSFEFAHEDVNRKVIWRSNILIG